MPSRFAHLFSGICHLAFGILVFSGCGSDEVEALKVQE